MYLPHDHNTAIHEAGHAICAHIGFGWNVSRVTVDTQAGVIGVGGYCRHGSHNVWGMSDHLRGTPGLVPVSDGRDVVAMGGLAANMLDSPDSKTDHVAAAAHDLRGLNNAPFGLDLATELLSKPDVWVKVQTMALYLEQHGTIEDGSAWLQALTPEEEPIPVKDQCWKVNKAAYTQLIRTGQALQSRQQEAAKLSAEDLKTLELARDAAMWATRTNAVNEKAARKAAEAAEVKRYQAARAARKAAKKAR